MVYIITKSDNSEFILIFATIVGFILGFLGTNYFEKKRRDDERHKEKVRAYAQLKGCRYALLQACENVLSSRMDLSYWNSVRLIGGNGSNLGIYKEMIQKYDHSALELSKSRAKFEKYLADIELLFSDSPRIDELVNSVEESIKDVYNFEENIKNSFLKIASVSELDNFFKNFNNSPERYISTALLANNIINLLDYLKAELEESKVKINADEAGAYYEETKR